MRPVLHVTQPSTTLIPSPPVTTSPAFLSTTSLPAPSTTGRPRRPSQSSSSSASPLPFWRRLAALGDRYTPLLGASSSPPRRRGSNASGHKHRRSFDGDAAIPAPVLQQLWHETGAPPMSLSRPATLLLPFSLAVFVVALLVTAADGLTGLQRARALVVHPKFRQLDLPGELPPLGWRAAQGWWEERSERSPWDFDAPGSGALRAGGWGGRGEEGRVRILFLVGFNDWLERMNTHTPELISAALAHPHVETDVWGPNWGGWDGGKTISENLKARRVWKEVRDVNGTVAEEKELRRAGAGYYDLVWTISDIFKTDSPVLDNPGHGTLFAQQLGDAHQDDAINKWYAPLLNITVVKYPHELEDMFSHERIMRRFPGMQMPLFGHSPDSANRWDFYPPARWEDKKVDMQGFGYDGSFYPIRTTVTNARKGYSNTGTDIQWYSHPGYTIGKPEHVDPPEFYEQGSPLHETHRRLRGEFAGAMRDTKICVFDSSLERKLIRKWAQALLSGCVVAGDIPTDREDDLREFMIELKQGWSIETINATLKAALEDQKELKRKAMLGFAYARSHLTNGKKVEGMLRLWKGYKEGWRGYDFPTGHSVKCRQYWAGESYRPRWCKPDMDLEGEWDRAHALDGP